MHRALEHAGRYTYAAASALALIVVGPFVPRHRRLLTEVARQFGYRRLGAPDEVLPVAQLDELVDPLTEFRLLEIEEHDGNVSTVELISIAKLTRAANAQVVFEIGTFNGRTTLNLAANAAADAVVHTLDLPASGLDAAELPLDPADRKYVAKERSGALFADSPLAARIRQHYGDSATFDFSPFRGAVDLVFVDGSHSYEYVVSDTARAREMIRDTGGVILWHDYGAWDGVTRALNELYAQGGAWRGLRRIRGTSLVYVNIGRSAA